MDTTTESERSFTVEGMTCAHCVAAVHDGIAALPGVADVEVDLDSGRLAFHGDGPSDDDVRAAVQAAGYKIG